MLIRIPDNYQAVETFLRRNGIPFAFAEEVDVCVANQEKIQLLNHMEKLEEINTNVLLELVYLFFQVMVQVPRNETERRLNRSIEIKLNEIINMMEL